LAWKPRRTTYANTIGCLHTNLGTEPVERIHLKVLQNNDPVISNYSLGYFDIFDICFFDILRNAGLNNCLGPTKKHGSYQSPQK